MKKALALTSASSLALAGIVLAAPAAQAKGNAIEMSGACSGTSTWNLEVKNKKAQLRTDFTVETDTAGQMWDFTLVRDDAGTPTLLAETSMATVASDDHASGATTSVARIAFRDRGEDDSYEHDSHEHDSMDDSSSSSSSSSSTSSSGMDDSDDDGPNHDAFDDDSNGMEDSHDSSDDHGMSSSSSPSGSSSHAAEVRFRTWIPNTGGNLIFTATYNGETCTVTL